MLVQIGIHFLNVKVDEDSQVAMRLRRFFFFAKQPAVLIIIIHSNIVLSW